jgi:hypothetical protein
MVGSASSDQNKARLGFLFLIVGLVLIFWACGSWMYRASVPVHAQAQVRAQGNGVQQDELPDGLGDRAQVARALWLFLIVGAGLILLVLFGTYAIVRAARRFRSTLEPEKPEEPDTRDVWSMHRLADEDEETHIG